MNNLTEMNITQSLESALRFLNLGIESFKSHLKLLPAGPSKDMFLHIKSKMINYSEQLSTRLRLLNINPSSNTGLLGAITLFKDQKDLERLENETEICLSAVYNLKSVYESLDKLINTYDLDGESYLLLYEVTESLKNDYKYLRSGLFTFSTLT
ncbi:hypothetical protein [Oceanirhabdus sp. W0125-5]|uniref:hypothetical protein n=1 Tax=Oceanirhabdus sp. W0125-5 TaxID=2999116 RepID=UPI0022F34427|nr:hypothetical protein [Oceanirhabdus sp. W0125-5]WBW99644.1 hypothetical protein OW730_13110 [Oceanirhabdus sp. W0125-5]